jgi:hypothetical protein
VQRPSGITASGAGSLHDHRHAIEHDDLAAPAELIGFPKRKAQRDIGCSRRQPTLLVPPPHVTPNSVVTCVIAAPRSSSKIRINVSCSRADLAAFPARIALRGILHRIRVPILITHGELNRQVPVESAHLAYNDCVNSPRRDLKIFAEQEGGEQHCSVVADWIPDVLITRKQELRGS